MVGRPTDYTDELGAEICSRMAAGESLASICRDDAMPSRSSVYLWLGIHKDFSDRYARAKEDRADQLFDEMFSIADTENMADTQRARLRVDTRKWALSKMLPDKYGDKLDLNHGGQPNNPLKAVEWVLPSKKLQDGDAD